MRTKLSFSLVILAVTADCGGSSGPPGATDGRAEEDGGPIRVGPPPTDNGGSGGGMGAGGTPGGTGGASGGGGTTTGGRGGGGAGGATSGRGGSGGAGGAGTGGAMGGRGGAGGGGQPDGNLPADTAPAADRPPDGFTTPGQCGAGGICETLENEYSVALSRARSCSPLALNQCQQKVDNSLPCPGCQVWVNTTVELDDVRRRYQSADCARCVRACPAILCLPLSKGVCTPIGTPTAIVGRPVPAGGVCTNQMTAMP